MLRSSILVGLFLFFLRTLRKLARRATTIFVFLIFFLPLSLSLYLPTYQVVKVLPLGGHKWNWLTSRLVELTSAGSVLIFVTKKQVWQSEIGI